jgi:group I intron endonuclease
VKHLLGRAGKKRSLTTFHAYKITCSENGKSYIGITTQGIRKRFSQHIRRALQRCGAESMTHLSMAIRKYGADAFDVTHIASASDFETLLATEMVLIRQHLTLWPTGYNRTLGGEGMLGVSRPVSDEQKRQISAALTGRRLSPEHRAAIAAGAKGAITDERRQATGDFHRGRIRSVETRAAISAGLTGKKKNPNSVAKMALSKTGSKASPETRQKMSEAHRALWARRRANVSQAEIAFL